MTLPVTLPNLNQTGKNEWADVEGNDVALREGVNELNTKVSALSGFKWYTPKVIATEETRESTSFGTLSTADEVTGVVLPENGLILVNLVASFKSSVSSAGQAAIFLGSNQLKAGASAQEAATTGTGFCTLVSAGLGLNSSAGATARVTTGQVVGNEFAAIFAAAGTYTVSIKYKATSGSVTAKERKLWVATLG